MAIILQTPTHLVRTLAAVVGAGKSLDSDAQEGVFFRQDSF